MEKVENKKVCCEGKEKCEHKGAYCHGCKWNKCCIVKIIIAIALIALAFYLGTQMKDGERGDRNGRLNEQGMINWKNNNQPKGEVTEATGEVTIQVKDAPAEAPKQ